MDYESVEEASVVVEEEDLDKVLVVKWEDEAIAVSGLYYNLL